MGFCIQYCNFARALVKQLNCVTDAKGLIMAKDNDNKNLKNDRANDNKNNQNKTENKQNKGDKAGGMR